MTLRLTRIAMTPAGRYDAAQNMATEGTAMPLNPQPR
jgi:hypothetical protein